MAGKTKLPKGVKRIIFYYRIAEPIYRGQRALPLEPSAPVKLPAHGVVITHIHYDGKVHRTQADEFIEIQNQGKASVDLSGWRVSAGNIGQNFLFPAHTIIKSQQRLRVYTDEIHPESGGFSFGSKRALWNDKGDIGLLFDASGAEISRWAYGHKATSPAQ